MCNALTQGLVVTLVIYSATALVPRHELRETGVVSHKRDIYWNPSMLAFECYYRFSGVLLEENAEKRADLVRNGVDSTSRYLTTMGIVGALLWSMSGLLATVDESDDAFFTIKDENGTFVLPYQPVDSWGDMWKWWSVVCYVNGMVSSAGCVLTSTEERPRGSGRPHSRTNRRKRGGAARS